MCDQFFIVTMALSFTLNSTFKREREREREMELKSSTIVKLLIVLQCLSVVCFAQDFDFFYFVQQWPGSYCDRKQSCCYPTTGKPAADFGIHGLWPNYNDGSYPSNCDPNSPYDQSAISDLISRMQDSWPTLACPSGDGSTFWSHEWDKHGTCSESVLDQHSYFKSALNLKSNIDLLQILQSAVLKSNKKAMKNKNKKTLILRFVLRLNRFVYISLSISLSFSLYLQIFFGIVVDL
ncbi:extracellular ribonuclease LE-like isoform X2 [Camellia sinensis]|uniref:extracellular ribonuclease LE-like isoform X2 n=1 Tax=Camellia sinensis TaxID=4442 RepID=UPI0010356A87|nr:extracellular ribonuclease LE-like isoform X2 [Camellia sinensis]